MITVTDKAAKFIKQAVDNRGKGGGVRVAVRTSGCSGYAYVIEFASNISNDDAIMVETKGVKIFIDKKSEVYLDGMEIDFVKEGLNEGLKFNNPNVTAECGCGESFNI